MKLLIALISLLAASAIAANDGNEVVVVFNSAMPESKDIANHYATLRKVPTTQVIGFELPKGELISRGQYRDKLEQPLLRKLESKKLMSFKGTNLNDASIRYIVLCYGVPLRIESDLSIKEKIDPTLKGDLRKNGAAVDSELAALPYIKQNHPLAGPWINKVYHTTNSWAINPTNGVIIVARLDGPTPEIARSLVDKAMQAERDGLWGRAYFDTRSITNVGFADVDQLFLASSEAAQQLGFETIVDKKPETFAQTFPMPQIALYAGWYDQDVSGPFTRSAVEFMPGAFAYHLHSFSAATLRSSNKHWAGPLLAKGAAATMGAVDEPMLGGLPDVGVFFTRWLVLGYTYGEAAYCSQPLLSWQVTVVGDPLSRPFAKPPQQQHEELARRGSKLVEWSHLKVINLNLNLRSPVAELVNYLEVEPTTKNSAVLTEKLGDLYQAQGKPESSIFAYRQALQRGPSPQQEVQLRLGLIEKLKATGKTKDAQTETEELRKRSPDYAPN